MSPPSVHAITYLEEGKMNSQLSSACTRGLVTVGLVLGLASMAQAQATRTWVSGVGDDANPCSRTAPCKTFAGAISKTAVGGFIDALDPGGFGQVTITKSITIDGGPGHAGIVVSFGNAIVVNGANITVNLRNLAIESPLSTPGNSGIVVLQAAEVHVENCWIAGFANDAIDFRPSGGGLGYVTDTTILNNSGGGIVVNTGRMTVNRLRAESNANGVIVNGGALTTVRDSYASGGGAGFGATVSAASLMNVENSVSTGNQYGIYSASGATVRVSNSMIISNTGIGLFNDGSSAIVSLGGNSLIGNPTAGSFTSTVIKQ
jgi:hypothetical protein